MPTYEYACKACGARLEVVQTFTDEPLSTCDTCGGPLRKVFGAVGIAFKGSGFYKTDSRSSMSSSSSSDGGSSSDKGSSTDKGDGGSTSATGKGDAKSDAKPSTAPAGTSEAKSA